MNEIKEIAPETYLLKTKPERTNTVFSIYFVKDKTTAIKNTKIVGEVVLDFAKKERQISTIIKHINEYINKNFDVKLANCELGVNVGAYLQHFKKKGLITW